MSYTYEVLGILDLAGEFSQDRPSHLYTEDDAMATAKALVEGTAATHRHVAITRTVTGASTTKPFAVSHVKRTNGETTVTPWSEFSAAAR